MKITRSQASELKARIDLANGSVAATCRQLSSEITAIRPYYSRDLESLYAIALWIDGKTSERQAHLLSSLQALSHV